MMKSKKEYMREYIKTYRRKNPEKARLWRNRSHRLLTIKRKYQVIEKFSGDTMKCKSCGFDDIRALSIDHIDGGGASERRKLRNPNPRSYYRWLLESNTPEKYQVLCMNCQFIKRFERGEHGVIKD